MRMYKTKKKWKIKCFRCRIPLNTVETCYRDGSGIYCKFCGEEIIADEGFDEIQEFHERDVSRQYRDALERWKADGKTYPKPLSPEEKQLRDSLIRKYGEW